MAEIQVTYWRDIPSMVAAREGDDVVKVPLAQRFQEAIDEAAMRLGEVDADAYLAGWTRSDWEAVDVDAATAVAQRSAALEEQWDDAALTAYLDGLNESSV
ncbi:MAG: virulence factor [Actinomycetota bacterium]|jgi:hypothetical protein|nr:virulence factor [Actinomycetota bacterium]